MHAERLLFIIFVFSGSSIVLGKSVPATTAGLLEDELQKEMGIGKNPIVVADYEDTLSWNCSEETPTDPESTSPPDAAASDIANVVVKDTISSLPGPESKEPNTGPATIPAEPLISQGKAGAVAVETGEAGRISLNTYSMLYKDVLQSQHLLPADNETSSFILDTRKRTSTHPRCRKTRATAEGAQDGDKESRELTNVETCKNTSGSDPVKILITENQGLAVYDVDSENITSVSLNNQHIYSSDYHFNKSLFFVTRRNMIIRGSLSLKNTSRTVAWNGVDGGVRLAVDWVHDRLFWMSDKYQRVEVADLDGGSRTVIIDDVKPFKYPNNIAVDPYEKYLFLVSNHTIYRTNLEGGDRKMLKLKDEKRKGVKCLTLDLHKKRIFFSGRAGSTSGSPYLASCDYHGQKVTEHHLGDQELNDIYSMGVFRETIYFAQFSSDEKDNLWALDLSKPDTRPEHLFIWPSEKGGMWNIRVYHPEVQNPNITTNSLVDGKTEEVK